MKIKLLIASGAVFALLIGGCSSSSKSMKHDGGACGGMSHDGMKKDEMKHHGM